MSKFSELLNYIDEIKNNLNDKQYKEIMDKLMELNQEKDDEIYYKLEYEEIVITPFAHINEDGEICCEIEDIKTRKSQFIKVVDYEDMPPNRGEGRWALILDMFTIGMIDTDTLNCNEFMAHVKNNSLVKDYCTSKIIYRISKFERCM